MAIDDKVRGILEKARLEGKDPVPDEFQGVSKKRIEEVLKQIDLIGPDLVDVVFALLDNLHTNWFTSAPKGAKFCEGASTAHLGCHVGILQRSGNKLDREGRDYWIKPLKDLGGIELCFCDKRSKKFIPGHPIPKSSNSAYRLSPEFVNILKADAQELPSILNDWIRGENLRERKRLQAILAEASKKDVDTKHGDLIALARNFYIPNFLKGFDVIYIDDSDGDRITKKDQKKLAEAGIKINLGDSMPDILLWNKKSDWIWVVEAVTSDGEVDEQKVAGIRKLTERSGKKGAGFTTAYRSWSDLAKRQKTYKNIAPHTHIWVAEDPSKDMLVRPMEN